MKHNVYLLITLSITTPCLAMEKKQPKFKEITAIQNPRQAFFLTQNRAVINGESGCSIVDFGTNEEIKKISDSNNAYLAIHPDKSVFALAHSNSFYIYDGYTGALRCDTFESRMPNIISAVFSHSNLIFLSYKENDKYLITRFIHNKNCYEPPVDETIIDYLIHCTNNVSTSSNLQSIICHPTNKELVCLINNHTGQICVTNIEKYLFNDEISNERPFYEKKLNGEYNADGSLLACYNSSIFFLLDTKTRRKEMLLTQENKIVTQAITFHPEDSIIAALSDKEGVQNIDYWDVKNKKIVASTVLPEMHDTDNTEWSLTGIISWFVTKEDKQSTPTHHSLSFSPDQKNLMVIIKNKCFLIPVPLGITCRTNEQEKVFLPWLLNNHQILPNDVTRNITNLFLEMLKR